MGPRLVLRGRGHARMKAATPCACGAPRTYYAKRCWACSVKNRLVVATAAERRCARCHETKPNSEFYADSNRRGGRGSRCKACAYASRTDKHRQSALKHRLRTKYGITLEAYDAMWAAQDGKCAACRVRLVRFDRRTHLDHCHATGRVRGILCRTCNMALGYAKESVARLRGLVRYLQGQATPV